MTEIDRRTWKRFGLLAACIVAAIAAVGIIVDQVVLPAIVRASDVVVVPSLVGTPLERAQADLAARQLVLVEPREQYSDKIPKGRVMSQLPYAGAQVKEGRRIYVTVSKGIETIEMPNVRGQLMRDARLTLMRAGLAIGDVQYEYSDSIEQNRIIKLFSIAAVIFLPPTLVASIYGMNYHLWPANDSAWGFPFAMALMVVSVGLTLWYFKRQRWL